MKQAHEFSSDDEIINTENKEGLSLLEQLPRDVLRYHTLTHLDYFPDVTNLALTSTTMYKLITPMDFIVDSNDPLINNNLANLVIEDTNMLKASNKFLRTMILAPLVCAATGAGGGVGGSFAIGFLADNIFGFHVGAVLGGLVAGAGGAIAIPIGSIPMGIGSITGASIGAAVGSVIATTTAVGKFSNIGEVAAWVALGGSIGGSVGSAAGTLIGAIAEGSVKISNKIGFFKEERNKKLVECQELLSEPKI